MVRIVALEEAGDGKVISRSNITSMDHSGKSGSLNDRGLRLTDTKPLLTSIQSEIVTHKVQQDAETKCSVLSVGRGAR